MGSMLEVTAREAARVVTHELRGLRAHVQSPQDARPCIPGPLAEG